MRKPFVICFLIGWFSAFAQDERRVLNGQAPDPNLYLTGPAVMTDPLGVCETLNQTGLFEYTQPNCIRFVETAGTPNDPLFAANWGLAKMNLLAAWDMTTGCSNIKIAIIDDGVQLNHPDLIANMLPGFDATNSGTNGGPVVGEAMHGTYCAGFAAASGNNGIGVTGVAYNSRIIPIRAFSTNAGNQGLRDGNKLDLDVSGLPRGTYYLHATASGGSQEKIEKLKLILE